MSELKTLRRFAAIGDIHSEDERPAAVLEHLAVEQLETILAVGDITDGVGSTRRCCELLIEAGVLAVRGNHDRWFWEGTSPRGRGRDTDPAELDHQATTFLAALPATRILPAIEGDLLLCHGVGYHDRVEIWPDDELNDVPELADLRRAFRWMVHGHSHRAMVRRFDHLTVINAGTLFREDRPGFVVVDLDERTVRQNWLTDELGVREGHVHDLGGPSGP